MEDESDKHRHIPCDISRGQTTPVPLRLTRTKRTKQCDSCFEFSYAFNYRLSTQGKYFYFDRGYTIVNMFMERGKSLILIQS